MGDSSVHRSAQNGDNKLTNVIGYEMKRREQMKIFFIGVAYILFLRMEKNRSDFL